MKDSEESVYIYIHIYKESEEGVEGEDLQVERPKIQRYIYICIYMYSKTYIHIHKTSKSSDKRSISVIFSSSNTCRKAGIGVMGGHLSIENSSQHSAQGLTH